MVAQLVKFIILVRMYLPRTVFLSRHFEVSTCGTIVVCGRCGFRRLMGKRWLLFVVR